MCDHREASTCAWTLMCPRSKQRHLTGSDSLATTIVTRHQDEPLRQDYQRLLDQGTKPNLAKLTLARKIAATALAMWKRQEVYDPDRYRKQ